MAANDPVRIVNELGEPAGTAESPLVVSTTTEPVSAVNVPVVPMAGAEALAANSSRKKWSLQNLGTNVLYVRLGSGASTTAFHVALQAGTANDDGKGGFVSDDSWQGVVSVAGSSPRYTVMEMT